MLQKNRNEEIIMFVVTYHSESAGSHFIGVADSYENAEKIIQKDMRQMDEECPERYNISDVWVNCPCPFYIEKEVEVNPYTR